MKIESISYLEDSIAKIKSGQVVSGSHIAGKFTKAVNPFVATIRAYVQDLLLACDLEYETDIRPAMKDSRVLGKSTLGQLVAVIETTFRKAPACVSKHIPGTWKATAFISTLKKINDTWVSLKYGDEVSSDQLLARMDSMLRLLRLLAASQANTRGAA